ncbi:MAG: hypothetical protein IPL32_19735 [Chloracidobacterium sp.]|nr:hypothetical protein [Chloracidobacterium sp.]
MILLPGLLGKHKGIDDFIIAEGGAKFAELVTAGNLLALSEYERPYHGRPRTIKPWLLFCPITPPLTKR